VLVARAGCEAPWLAHQAAGAQICHGIDLVDGHQARDATASPRHDHLAAALDVLGIAAQAIV
jgi:hypothetical protein